MAKRALITGITGQDGSYLAEHLLSLGYEVHGLIRRNSITEHQQSRLEHIADSLHNEYGDVLDVTSTPEQLGKRTQKDADKGKNTYPSLMGLEESRAEAHRHMDSALAALSTLGGRATGLKTLAQFVVTRQK